MVAFDPSKNVFIAYMYSYFPALHVKFSRKSPVAHQLLTKRHTVRGESIDRPPELTLFVGNVPPYLNEVRNRSVISSTKYSIAFEDTNSVFTLRRKLSNDCSNLADQ